MEPTWNWAGARWWSFDFHTHSPASNDYGKGANQEHLKQLTPQEWLLHFMRAKIDCVAVTDHNTGAWVDPLKQALVELAGSETNAEPHPEYRALHLFPGVELTVQTNIHLLAIFPTDRTTADIDSLLGAVKYRSTKGTSDGCTESSAVEVIEEIVKFGGIAIPAHVDQSKGLFVECAGQTLAQILSHKELKAIESIDPNKARPSQYTELKLNCSDVLGSDSHHPTGTQGQRYPGSHFTWVKMSHPSLEGLRLALIDGDLSLKRSDINPDNPNTYGQIAIESIVVSDAKFLGRQQPFFCNLNPWLNSIIGGRGTGKSTVLELLRTALNRSSEIPSTLANDYQKYHQISKIRTDDGLLTDATIVVVHFLKDGCRFRTTWKSLDSSFSFEKQGPGGWAQAEGEIHQRLPVRIYSQKQIFELSKHPQALLQVIDEAPSINYRDWKAEKDSMVSAYLSHKAQEREMESGLGEELAIKGQLDDLKTKLDVFERTGHSQILKEYQLRQNQNKAIEAWSLTLKQVAEKINLLKGNLLPPSMELNHFSTEREEDSQLIEVLPEIYSRYILLADQLEKTAADAEDIRTSWLSTRSNLEISKKIAAANKNYDDLIATLSQVGATDPSIYAQLLHQRQSLEDKLKIFEQRRILAKEHEQKAEEYLAKIRKHRNEITNRRDAFLKTTLAENQYVKICAIPHGHTDSAVEEFRELISRPIGFDRDIGASDAGEGILAMLTDETIGSSIEDRVERIKSLVLSIHENDIASVALIKDRRFVSHLQGLPPEQIDRIRCWFLDDSLDVRYSLKQTDTFRPVDQGSPGQKTAALLAFILSYGDEPLLFDQPEDDLDNQLIYDLIVKHLRQIKQTRQIIVVTHNANIVVNGDSENVIVLDVRGGQSQIVAQGCLQDASIRVEICRIMEGGKEAFEQRYKRITST